MTDPKKVRKLLARVEGVSREADRAAGAKAQLLKRLQEEYGCASLEEAEKLLEKKEKELAKLGDEFDRDFAAFEQKWSPYLEGERHG